MGLSAPPDLADLPDLSGRGRPAGPGDPPAQPAGRPPLNLSDILDFSRAGRAGPCRGRAGTLPGSKKILFLGQKHLKKFPGASRRKKHPKKPSALRAEKNTLNVFPALRAGNSR